MNADERERFERLESSVDNLVSRFAAIEAQVKTAWENIEPLLSEVLPLVKRIEESPMFRMIAPRKKER